MSIAPRAQYVGLTERDVTNSLVVNLAGSGQVAPTYWLNPDNGVSYAIVMQTPQYQIDSLNALQNLPITAAGAPSQTLGAIADITRVSTPAVYSQYNIMPMVQIYATTQGRDLGAVAADVQKCHGRNANEAPKGVQAVLLGQVRTMNNAFAGLLFGLLGRHRADLSADRGQFPVVERSVRDRHGAARGAGRHRVDAVRHPHDAVGAGADRRHHVHGRRHRQQRPRRQLRPRAARTTRRSRSRRRSKRVSSASVRC